MSDEERYNNRQIERMLDEQSKDIKDHMDMKIAPLLTQVLKTNGRVNFNEKMIYLAMGAIPLCASVMSWMLLDYLDFKKNLEATLTAKVEDAVYQALDNYQWEVVDPINEQYEKN